MTMGDSTALHDLRARLLMGAPSLHDRARIADVRAILDQAIPLAGMTGDPTEFAHLVASACDSVRDCSWMIDDDDARADLSAALASIANVAAAVAGNPAWDDALRPILASFAFSLVDGADVPSGPARDLILDWLRHLVATGSDTGEVAAATALVAVDIERWRKRGIADTWLPIFSPVGLAALSSFRWQTAGDSEAPR